MKKFLGDPLFLNEAKQSKKPGHNAFAELLIFIPVFFVIQLLETVPVVVVSVIWIIAANFDAASSGSSFYYSSAAYEVPDVITIFSLLVTVLGTVIALLFCRYIEERKISSMGLRKKSFFTEYLLGGAFGIIMIFAAALCGIVSGALTITPGTPSALIIIACLIGFFLQGMSEEVIFRGYLMTSMTRRNGIFISVLLSSFAFSVTHLGNPGISATAFINIMLFGALAAVLFIKRGSIWAACGMHTFWNFYQGTVFGISVSGAVKTGGSIFNAAVSRSMPEILTGGDFGLEGSLFVTAIEIIFLLLFILVLPKKKDEQCPL